MFDDFMWQKFTVSGDVCDYLVYSEECENTANAHSSQLTAVK